MILNKDKIELRPGETLEEALSRKWKDGLSKIEDNLVKELELSRAEARYLTGVYGAIKDNDLFKSKYFTDFKYEGQLIDFSNMQMFFKNTETFYDVVMYVLHSSKFLEIYNIQYDKNGVELKKKVKKEKEKSSGFTTPYDAYKVAEDDRYVTFEIPNSNVSKQLKEYYFRVFPNDKLVKSNRKFFVPTACIMGSSAKSYFSSQKEKKSDTWYASFLKVPPYKFLNSLPFVEGKIESVGSLFDGNNINKLRNQLGEIYLSGGTKGYNYGYHNFINNPGSGTDKTSMYYPVKFNYSAAISSQFTITGTTLTGYNGKKDDSVITIPHGVTSIGYRAFEDVYAAEIILPFSLTEIKAEAFYNCDIRFIVATNNLQYISKKAVISKNKLSVPKIGVPKRTGPDTITISKPSRLVYYPEWLKNIMNAHAEQDSRNKIIDDALVENEDELADMDEQGIEDYNGLMDDYEDMYDDITESTKMSFKVKKPAYFSEGIFDVEGNIVYFIADLDKEAVKEIFIPEGATILGEPLSGFSNLELISFPSTFTTIGDSNFKVLINQKKKFTIDLGKTEINEIPQLCFALFRKLTELHLPETLRTIQKGAFNGINISSIFLTSDLVFIDSKALAEIPFLDYIYTDDVLGLVSGALKDQVESLEKLGIEIKKI